MVIAGIGNFISTVTFIIHNVRTGYSGLSTIGKTSLYMWWGPLAFVFSVIVLVPAIGGPILWTGYLMFGRGETLIDFIGRMFSGLEMDTSETFVFLFAWIVSFSLLLFWTSPFVAWVLFLCDADNRPYRAVDILFIVSAGWYFFCVFFIMPGFVFGWTYISRRLWIASHATNPTLVFASPWKVSSWRSAFSQGDWPANVVLLLRIDKLVLSWAEFWIPRQWRRPQ